jgi:peptide/nickel transport system ATP-binding protein
MAMILITHDLGVVAGRTDEVAVMYAGGVVERAPTQALFKNMHMPYTEAFLPAIPKMDAAPHTPLPAISGRPPDSAGLPVCAALPPRRRSLPSRQAGLVAAETSDHQYACFNPVRIAAGALA